MDAESNWLKKNPVVEAAAAEKHLDPGLDPRLGPDLDLVPGLNLVLDLEAVLLPEIEDRIC